MVAADSRRDTDLLIYSKRNRMSSPNGMTSGFLVSVCQERTVLSVNSLLSYLKTFYAFLLPVSEERSISNA